MTKIHILTGVQSKKLVYVFDFVFRQLLGIDFEVTNDALAFEKSSHQAKLNYSKETIPLTIPIVTCSDYFAEFSMEEIPQIESTFRFEEQQSNFDLFAAIFFLIARVEEYQPSKVDEHNRYLSSESLLTTKGLLARPIIDLWVQALGEHLNTYFSIPLQPPTYSSTSTIDVDHISAYKGKPFLRSMATMIRDLLSLKLAKLSARLGQDPFDTYAEIIRSNDQLGYKPIFFILTASRSPYDRSLPPSHKLFIDTVKDLAGGHPIGIHPSYKSNSNDKLVNQEISQLATISDQNITKSRQHYLKMSLPQTYRNLIYNGIEEDHSMGYADRVGFRAGTSQPFYWYDIEQDKVTSLKVVPFCMMDVTFNKYLNLDPDSVIDLIGKLVADLKAVGGHCSFIWHNSSFYKAEGWKGWDKVYIKLLQIARP